MEESKKFRHNREKSSEGQYNDSETSDCDSSELGFDQTSNYTLKETAELDDMIEKEKENVRHILEIEKRLNSIIVNEAEMEILSLLQMLPWIVQSVEDLKATNIGRTVSNLQYHWSTKVSQEAKKTIDGFKKMINDRACDNAAFSERSKDHTTPPTMLDENVLLIPPLDEGISMSSISFMDLSKIFDDLDDDAGNPKISKETRNIQETKRKDSTKNKTEEEQTQPSSEESSTVSCGHSRRKEKQQHISKRTNPMRKCRSSHKNRIELAMIHPTSEKKRIVERQPREEVEVSSSKTKRQKASKGESNRRSLTNHSNPLLHPEYLSQTMQVDVNSNTETREKNNDIKHRGHQRPNTSLASETPSPNDANKGEKLEVSKRRLQMRYPAHEKRRRNTMFIEDISKDMCKDISSSRSSSSRNVNKSTRK